jgi:cysteine desulfurase
VDATAYTYLDHAATTPMRPAAVQAMLPYLSERFANPSGSHRFSREVRKAVDDARETVAQVIGCQPGEVIFTGGGTEADNTALLGADNGALVCPATEHHAVLDVVRRAGGSVVAVDETGHVDLVALAARLDDAASPVSAVSVMAVNNEVGTITDMAAVAAVVARHGRGAMLHTDAVQAACWVDLRDVWAHVDMLSLSAHKFGGPKGVGVLAVRAGSPLRPLIIGGGQERERRSGTHNVPGIVAMASALQETDAERVCETERIGALRDFLVDTIRESLPEVIETVPRARKVAGSAHLCVPGVENESLLFLLDEAGVCASAASACASGAMEPSHVLAAMGVPIDVARGALRLTLGSTTTADDVHVGAHAVIAAVQRLQMRTVPA